MNGDERECREILLCFATYCYGALDLRGRKGQADDDPAVTNFGPYGHVWQSGSDYTLRIGDATLVEFLLFVPFGRRTRRSVAI